MGIPSAFVTNYEAHWNYDWKEIRPEIRDSIQVAALHGISSGIGSMGNPTDKEIRRRYWIMKQATNSELLRLIDYPDGTVKAIAYEGLLRRNFSQKPNLILQAVRDTTHPLAYQSGCIIWDREISEYLFHDVLRLDQDLPQPMRSSVILDESDRQKIMAIYEAHPPRQF